MPRMRVWSRCSVRMTFQTIEQRDAGPDLEQMEYHCFSLIARARICQPSYLRAGTPYVAHTCSALGRRSRDYGCFRTQSVAVRHQ